MRFLAAYKILTRVLLINTISYFVCISLAWHYHEPIRPFALSAIISSILAGGIYFYKRKAKLQDLKLQEAYFSVSISWFTIALTGSLPYIFSGYFPSIVDAVFESISGFTTTGSSILTYIEALPKSILFWRSLTHWIGGIGIIVLVIIIMPSLKMGSYNLFTLESSLKDRTHSKTKAIGYRLLFIYLFLTISEVILLSYGKMNLFESVCHAFGTIATGGFSPKNDSIAGYSSYIQYTIAFFMVLSGTNFIIHYFLLKRNFSKIKKNEELRLYLFILLLSVIIVSSILFFKTNKPLEVSFREALFQVVSILTCTGYATADYLKWPDIGWTVIFMLMFIGGSTGSTSGGIKIARHLTVLKNIKRLYKNLLHPHAVIPIRLNGKTVPQDNNRMILTFISWYILFFIFGSIILTLSGIDPKTSMSSIATAMGGIGPGIGTVGPASNFAHLSHFAKIVLSFFMILGRLEIYAVIIIFTPGFWKNY